MKEISVNKLQDMIKDKVVELIDVRENNEYQYCKVCLLYTSDAADE